MFQQSVLSIRDQIDTHHLNLDGSHAPAKKGGEAVAYQGRKKAKTSNVLPITDANGFILATTGIIAGNHNDAFELKDNLRVAFTILKRLGITIAGCYFNADAAFDTKAARWTCFNHKLIPPIVENTRSRKKPKRGRQRRFNPDVYKRRFTSERTFAWIELIESFEIVKGTSSVPYWCALTAKRLTSWALITSFTRLSTSAIYWQSKSLNEFNLDGIRRAVPHALSWQTA